MENINYSIDKDEMDTVGDVVKQHAEAGDTIKVTEDKPVNETLKMGIFSILKAFNINTHNKSPEEIKRIKSMIKNFVQILNKNGITNLILTEEDDEQWDIEDFGKANREIEYGVKSENFIKIMNELKKSNGPKVKLTENIRPRIKKSDFINYIKNQK